jgi:hypothetical protein
MCCPSHVAARTICRADVKWHGRCNCHRALASPSTLVFMLSEWTHSRWSRYAASELPVTEGDTEAISKDLVILQMLLDWVATVRQLNRSIERFEHCVFNGKKVRLCDKLRGACAGMPIPYTFRIGGAHEQSLHEAGLIMYLGETYYGGSAHF